MSPALDSDVLVLGGGIAGIQCALDVADAGLGAVLVERAPSIGGTMAMLDKTFPTLDCSVCIEAPKMLDLSSTRGIRLVAHADLVALEGGAGAFRATVIQRPRHVLPDCTACGRCEEVCPVEVPAEFDQGTRRRKAIFMPHVHSVPRTYTLDLEACRRWGGGCRECWVVCREEVGHNLIDFWQKPETLTLNVASVVVATGLQPWDPTPLEEYAYGRERNVITAAQLERLLNSAGPTQGSVPVLAREGRPRVALIQCVGSRDLRWMDYCSKVCCTYAAKQAVLVKEQCPRSEVVVFFMDRRYYGKDYDVLYRRARSLGVEYRRGRPWRVAGIERGERLSICYEDTTGGGVREEAFDLVVLCAALQPPSDQPALARILGVDLDGAGFLREPDPLRRPLETTRPGVFACGFARGPADVAEAVAQATAAAASAAAMAVGNGRTTAAPAAEEARH
ncbi:MAG: CoB--CoM heterodisulfide reductase iron-sulfur subunit A family protein [Deltaproteobacteria bacterium]|nr:CoB--CoM heterodisulfide reductase iron-sulfur subunit A family protein [Deltaproteobacteria bacterium]